MILWGIGCAFCLFTLLSIIPLLWVHDNQALHAVANATFFRFCCWLSTIFITTSWVISVSGWSVAKRAFTLTDVGSNVELGNAIWIGLVCTILLWILQIVGWPVDALGGAEEDYYHYRQTVREVQRPRV